MTWPNLEIQKIDIEVNKHTLVQQDNTAFFSVWRTSKAVTDVSLRFNEKDIPNDVVHDILYSFSLKSHDLTRLSLDLSNCKTINDKSLSVFFEMILPKMSKLRHLKLLLGGTSISDISLMKISKKYNSLVNSLIEFHMDLDNTKVTHKSLTKLFVPMSSMSNYGISLRNTKVTDNDIAKLAQGSLYHSHNLQSLMVYLSYTQVTDQSTLLLLKQFQNLRKLCIELDSTKITSKSLEFLGRDYLPNMKLLEHFELSVSDCGLGDADIALICVPMEKMKELYLGLGKNKITDQSLITLVNTTLASARGLERIIICLDNTAVTDTGVSALGTVLHSVTEFILYLRGTNVTDEFIKVLLETLPLMKNLRNFIVSLEETKVDGRLIEQLEQVRSRIIARAEQSNL